HFEEMAVPVHGRYVGSSAIADATGVTYLPPKQTSPATWGKIAGILTVGILAYAVYRIRRRNEEQRLELLSYETF
ncbi:MAG: hypothetical protein ABIQ56_03560, partial [Chitinophagaceae bacterium]